MMVLTNILRNDFLMQELRVKGGAYGAMTGFVRNGNMFFCSYRDPNLTESLAVYDQVADYVANFGCTERDLEKYIIGTMAELEMPKTPSQQASESNSDFITGLTLADHQRLRTEVLSTTLEDIRAFAPLIQAVMADNQFCVFGNEKKLQDNAEIFDKVVPAISR
jgi:Zn-dependent M16 (insulinase) family peptidase